MCACVCVCVCLSVCLSVCPPVCLFICPSARLSVHPPSVCRPARLFLSLHRSPLLCCVVTPLPFVFQGLSHWHFALLFVASFFETLTPSPKPCATSQHPLLRATDAASLHLPTTQAQNQCGSQHSGTTTHCTQATDMANTLAASNSDPSITLRCEP